MNTFRRSLRIAPLLAACLFSSAFAAEPVTLENFTPPAPNRADEPLAKEFSLEKAVHFLDSAALEWQTTWGCFTCHTNISYLVSRPHAARLAPSHHAPSARVDAPAHKAVRKFAEEMIAQRWGDVGSRFDAEVVAVGVALALNDRATGAKLHPLTRIALDKMWTAQREAGDWAWPTGCRWPPMESDDHYGVTFAAIGTGAAPENYAATPAARAGLAKIRTYLKQHPPANLHHKGMLLWASSYFDDLITAVEKQTYIRELLAEERPGGGWAFSRIYPWDRGDNGTQDLETADAYGTAFSVFVLRKAGLAADEPAVKRGVEWLKTRQRASGRWFSRSLNKDNEHYISHAATAYALMALAECETTSSAAPPPPAVAAEPEVTDSLRPAKARSSSAVRLSDDSPALVAYRAEQTRRSNIRLAGLRSRLAEAESDPSKAALATVLKAQLADLEQAPAEQVSFDAAYGHGPATGRLGYSKKARFLEHAPDGRSIILVENDVLFIALEGTEGFTHGKFFGIDQPILVGKPREDYVFRNKPKKTFDAELVELP